MDDFSTAIAGIIQSTTDMANSYKSLDSNLEMLIANLRQRELMLIYFARKYPLVDAEDIIAAVGQHQSVDRGAPQ